MSEHASSQALIRQIVARVKCAVCGHHFKASDIQVLGHREQIWAMKVKCRECRTEALLLAAVEGRATRSVYTDLAPDEWQRFADCSPITVDDVITMHQFIESYDGDFSEILEDPLPEDGE